ncbi:CNO10 protein, partial [Erpornis zantholeuca]|nr:CNO10 protein [Erpornis zantholeuca]
ACLQHLNTLQDINKDDYKITLNTAVAEFCKSNQTTTDNLRQTLNQLKNQVMQLQVIRILSNTVLRNEVGFGMKNMFYLYQGQQTNLGEEEKFAQAVCFLLVDLYLLTYQAEKALHLLAVLEKMISQGNNNSKNGKNE